MSMSLYVWKSPVLDDEDEARRLLALEDESVFEPSVELGEFARELLERFPSPGSLGADELRHGATPWADPPQVSDRLVALSIRWSADDGDVDAVVALALEHDLGVYDPQGPSFYSSTQDEGYSPGIGEFIRGGAVGLVGVLVALVGWKLSLPVLSWFIIFVGGFITVVAVVSLFVTARELAGRVD
jgi:hypothetical protein